jgi:hypothetical protein
MAIKHGSARRKAEAAAMAVQLQICKIYLCGDRERGVQPNSEQGSGDDASLQPVVINLKDDLRVKSPRCQIPRKQSHCVPAAKNQFQGM